MLKIGLVEDEVILLEDLKESIDWKSMEVEIIWQARNGKMALKKINENRPDIIITDIRMPVMNGIELLQHIREQKLNLQVLFLTGYDDREYMKIAIDKEVVGYILKPFNEMEIKQAIEKARQKIDVNYRAEIGYKVYKEKELRRILYNRQGKYENFPGKYRMYLISCMRITKRQEKFSQLLSNKVGASISECIANINDQFTLCHLQDNKYILVVNEENPCAYSNQVEIRRIATLVESINNIHVLFVGYEELVEPREFGMAYECLMNSSEYICYYSREYVMFNKDFKYTNIIYPKKLMRIKQNIFSAINKNNEREISEQLEKYFGESQGYKVSQNILRVDLQHILERIYDNFFGIGKEIEQIIREKGQVVEEFKELENIEMMKSYLVEYVRLTQEQAVRYNHFDEEQITNYILYYLKQNYAEDIQVETLLNTFYIAPSTVRGEFKKKTGKTIQQYLTQIRMEEAAKFLADPHLKIKQVAMKVGYDNLSYFGMVFMKEYGVTPKQYRVRFIHLSEEEG